ncbi:hypothetical protein B0J11DRAFT_579968 [Dendryphion nanum]|uniref:Protein prenyltransferase alpha subunit n=1 Tax=Dendryphion nanum TaxID=256645 RepID=A0A9P9DUQ8_9PLEO|nr:hypothetical protein B0J11DRAFT_579968 [Dendryphion nanum]
MAEKLKAQLAMQNLAYTMLDDFFNAHKEEVVEIEILPPHIEPENGICMVDGINIGLPKKILALAYLQARQLFFSSVEIEKASSLALSTSRMILLFDPEHLTAANFRKRYLTRIRDSQDFNETDYQSAVSRELVFINSILTSPLHRQSKSPTLWHHRLWLLNLRLPLRTLDESGNQLLILVTAELNDVLKSGERHPKNYYAWQYARRLHTQIKTLHREEIEFSNASIFQSLVSASSVLVKEWCCKHPSDISGWTFLLHLLSMVHLVAERHSIVKQVLEYAINLQLKFESIWVFIRLALASDILQGEQDATLHILQHYWKERETLKKNDEIDIHVVHTIEWVKKYKKPYLDP